MGPFELLRDGQPLPCLRWRKGCWLLAILVLRQDREVERTWLADTLWPGSPQERALASLRMSVLGLRRVLGAEARRLYSSTRPTLRLDLSGAEVDLIAFDQAIARGDPASLEAAVALYWGPLLEGCAEEWVLEPRQAREQAYLQALEALATEALAEGRTAAAERYLRQAVTVEPLRESAQRSLMRALAEGGSYGAALEVYRELRLLLHRELNARPDPETTVLFEQLRAKARKKAALDAGGHRRPLDGGPAPSRGELQLSRAPAGSRLSTRGPQLSTETGRETATLTFLFTDIEGSTRFWEAHPKAMRRVLVRHEELLRREIEAYGGRVFKTVGDSIAGPLPTLATL